MKQLYVWLICGLAWTLAGTQFLDAGELFFFECTDFETGKIVVRLPLDRHETVTLRYIHSVDHTPVHEIFEIDAQGCLALQATYFKMFGAGMGHWEGRGRLDFDGTWTWIRDIHETLGSFVLRVGAPSVDHTLLYRDREIHLSREWAGKRLVVAVVDGRGGMQNCRQGPSEDP